MSKHLLLKQKLYGIEQGEFQEVGNNYLKKTYGGHLESPGTMEDKTKTRKGKPDTFLVQDDGSYIIAEFTTHSSLDKKGFAAKLKSDLEGCLQFADLGLTARQVRRVVLCCNSTVDIPLREELKKIIEPYGIPLSVVSLSDLVDFYENVGKVFAQDVLGVPFETGQVVDKSGFLETYGHKKIATPLDNTLFGRERELSYLKETLGKSDIILIFGAAGVGKSRLALQVIDNFVEEHPEYEPYYILSVRESIFEDLLSFLLPEHSYIVFIDDANRQTDNVSAVLNRAASANIKVKVVMTVRDYAREEIEKEIRDFNFKGVFIGNLSDDTINQILYSAPFNVQDHAKRSRIVAISKGNPRLALMAADVLAKDPDAAILTDASEIYDVYFKNIFYDKAIFNDPLTIKVLGVLAFIETIDRDETKELELLELFEISIDDFNQRIALLEELELVSVKYNSIIKIGDQVLGTYFFYQAFFKQKLLDPELLIFNYFQNYRGRILDTFIPAINNFGVENVIGSNPVFLTNYLDQVKGVESAVIAFFEVFGVYFPYKVFPFVKQVTESATESPDDFDFLNAYKNRQPDTQDPILRLLEPFYQKGSQEFLTAVSLAVRYVQKKKGLLDMLVNQLRSPLWASGEDVKAGFEKQVVAYNFFTQHLSDSAAFSYLFYYTMQHVLLNTRFNHELYVFKEGETTLEPGFATLRQRFLTDVRQNFSRDRAICFDLLIEYLEGNGQESFIYLKEDQDNITAIIREHLSPKDFGDCFFVQEYINLLHDKLIPVSAELNKVQKRFHSAEYKIIRALALERNDKRQKFRDYRGWEVSQASKIAYIGKNIHVTELNDFRQICAAVHSYLSFKHYHKYHIGFGLTVLFENIFEQNINLGFEALAFYLSQDKIFNIVTGRLFYAICRLTGECERLYQVISTANFVFRQEWLERYHDTVPEACINETSIARMLNDFKNASNHYTLHYQFFEAYEKVKPGTIRDIAAVLLQKSDEDPEFIFKLDYFFLEKYPFIRDHDFDLAKRLYLRQDKINHDFDPRGSELFFLMQKDMYFFREYIDYRLQLYQEFYSAPRMIFTEIWKMEKGPELIYEALLKFGAGDVYSYGLNAFSTNFFIQLKAELYPAAVTVLEKLIQNYSDNPKVLSIVWDIGRNYLKPRYGDLIRYWLLIKADIALFTACDWCNNSFSYSGAKQVWGYYRAEEYKLVFDAVSELPEPYLYVEIQAWLIDRIAREKRSGDWERKRDYRRF